ncbi:MAG: HAMP domain-containing histidine kinase [Gammaproteobacteria bacterium]|nr:HAMP domain-containing histidine kinase [Gammaproteobacteria bacterium]
MDPNQYYALLYDMALATSGETRTSPLLTKALQRLLYHTGFPCGYYVRLNFYNIPGDRFHEIEHAICGARETRIDYEDIELTESVIARGSQLFEDADQIRAIIGDRVKATALLILPVKNDGVFLLLSTSDHTFAKMPYRELLTPILDNFSKNLALTRANETNMRNLEQEILDHKSTLDALKIAKEEVETASNAKSDFLSRMSHELRTPLNAIMGFAQLLAVDADQLSDVHEDYVKEINVASTHLLNLINEVLDMARIESGRLELNLNTIHSEEILAECLTLMQPLANKAVIELHMHLNDKPALVSDRLRIKQVLINLISNAIKYNKAYGHVDIDVRSDGEHVVFSVKDTGTGITDEDREKVFSPFERLNDRDGVEGTGIGMALTAQLVSLLGGSIDFESKKDVGSNFWVRLPKQPADALQQAHA